MQGKRKSLEAWHKDRKSSASSFSHKKTKTLKDSVSDEDGPHNFYGLDESVILNILSKLEIHELCRCALVCSHWKRLASADYLWQSFYGQHTGIYVSSWKELCSTKYQETHGIDALKEALCTRKRNTRRSLLYVYPLDRKYVAPGLEYQKLYESVFKVTREGLKGILLNEVESLLKDEEVLAELRSTAANWLRSYTEEHIEELTYNRAKELLLDLLKYEGDYDSQGFPVLVASKKENGNPELVSNEDVKDFTEIKERVMGLLQQVTQNLDLLEDVDGDARQELGQELEGLESGKEERNDMKEEEEGKGKEKEREDEKEELPQTQLPLQDCRRRWFSDLRAQRYAAWMLERFPANRARFFQIGPVWPVFRYYVTGLLCISNRYFTLYWIEANPTYPIDVTV